MLQLTHQAFDFSCEILLFLQSLLVLEPGVPSKFWSNHYMICLLAFQEKSSFSKLIQGATNHSQKNCYSVSIFYAISLEVLLETLLVGFPVMKVFNFANIRHPRRQFCV